MTDKGANPFVMDYSHWLHGKGSIHGHLSNLPSKKSIFFTTRSFPDEFEAKSDFPAPWFYRTGVFDGKFRSVVGRGASAVVLNGEWYGKKAAYKFVEIGFQKFQQFADGAIKTLDKKLSEMISISELVGSKIVPFYGHYR